MGRPALTAIKVSRSLTTRRILIALTILVLLLVSVGVGVLVANWPQWSLVHASDSSQG